MSGHRASTRRSRESRRRTLRSIGSSGGKIATVHRRSSGSCCPLLGFHCGVAGIRSRPEARSRPRCSSRYTRGDRRNRQANRRRFVLACRRPSRRCTRSMRPKRPSYRWWPSRCGCAFGDPCCRRHRLPSGSRFALPCRGRRARNRCRTQSKGPSCRYRWCTCGSVFLFLNCTCHTVAIRGRSRLACTR